MSTAHYNNSDNSSDNTLLLLLLQTIIISLAGFQFVASGNFSYAMLITVAVAINLAVVSSLADNYSSK